VRKRSPAPLDFEVDKLTNSIENILTGQIFETEIVRLKPENIQLLKRSKWQFNWRTELKSEHREIYGLITKENPSILHGIMSIEDLSDHFFLHLIESAALNKGHQKLFAGVAPNLVAFACKKSFEKGYGGHLAFVAKSALIEHYKNSLGAKRLDGNRMFLDTEAAYPLVRSYFKDFNNARL
jgi:hypothetical protein